MNKNGKHLDNIPILGMQRAPSPVKFEFSEIMFRGMVNSVKQEAERVGGAVPMPDPAGLLALGLVMDKLNDIQERLTAIEGVLPPPRGIMDAAEKAT